VNKTPTFFVNGRIVIGVPPAPAFYAIVDEALPGPALRTEPHLATGRELTTPRRRVTFLVAR